MAIIDLRKLLGGPSLIVKYTLAYRGLATIIKRLIVTGALLLGLDTLDAPYAQGLYVET